MHGYGDGFMMGGMWLWWIFAAAVMVPVVWTILRSFAPSTQQVEPTLESPEEILKRRYAAGEIDRDEFLTRLEHLKS